MIKVKIIKPLLNYKVGECVLMNKSQYEKYKDSVEVVNDNKYFK
jgi:hypothetical protein